MQTKDDVHLAPRRAGAPEGPARARRVLIVDDENTVRELMRRWLEAGGYSVTAAATAEEALGRLEMDAPPAVALCDIRMPGHDGLWLAERIRQRYPETAVIMATGVQDVGPAVESLRNGVIDYLTKPFGRDRLGEAVSRRPRVAPVGLGCPPLARVARAGTGHPSRAPHRRGHRAADRQRRRAGRDDRDADAQRS